MIKHLLRVAHSVIREATKKRSGEWPAVRRAHLALKPLCECCGGKKLMQVHHVDPYHLDPAKELDPSNLISLCMGSMECHLRIGHGDNFKAYNPHVRTMAESLLAHPDDKAMRTHAEEIAKASRKYEEGAK